MEQGMKRTPLRRKAPLRQRRREGSDIVREEKPWAQALASSTVRPLSRGTMGGGTSGVPVPKEETVQHEGYRRLVALFPCKGCGIGFLSQCAHPNTGKATGKKLIDDRLCFPLCADSPGRPGCHAKFDRGALFDKATRRLLEPAWGADTRRQIIAAGMWPKDLPMLVEQPDGSYAL